MKKRYVFFIFILIFLIIFLGGNDMVTINRSKAGIYKVGDDGYNFEDDIVGGPASTWSVIVGDADVVNKYQNHYHPLKVYDNAVPTVIRHVFASQSNGYVQFYINVVNAIGDIDFDFDMCKFSIAGASGSILYTALGGEVDTGDDITYDTWYQITIVWNNSGGVVDNGDTDGNLADGKFRFYVNDVSYGDYDVINGNDFINFDINDAAGQLFYFDAVAFSWDGTYSYDDNLSLEDDATIASSLISQLKIHYPTTLEPTNVKFDGKTYEKYYPVCIAKINPSEDVFLGCTIKITDNLTSGGATASSVIFKGEVVKKLTKETSGFIPSYLIFSNAKEMDFIKPEGSYTKDTDGYISDILTNLCDKLTEGTLSDGADLGTFTAAGDKSFTLIIKQSARFDGYLAYIDSSAGADNADLMYNDGSTDTGVDIDESSATLRGLRAFSQLDEHINKVIVRGGIQSDGTRAEGTASDTTSQGLYGIVPTYDTDTNLNTDALCASKAAQILADNEFGNRRVVLGYKDATKGMLQPGETVTFDWDATVHDIGFSIEQEQYIIARNIYDVKTGVNVLTLFSSIYYPPISDGELLQETSHVALQNSDNIATNNTSMEAFLAIGAGNAQWQPCVLELSSVPSEIIAGGGYIRSVGASDPIINFIVPLPITRGGLSLYITKIRTWIYDADSNDKITNTYLYGRTEAGVTTLETDATDYDTATTEETYTFASARDCSSYDQIVVGCTTQTTTANELDHMGVSVEYYYA